MKIIGIAGLVGAGKGVVADYLVKKGFTHYSVRKFLVEELERRGTPVSRMVMIELADEIRREETPGHIVDVLFEEAKKGGKPAIIESIRALAEAESIRGKGGVVLGVTCDKKIRFDRLKKRGSVTDDISFEQFVLEDEREAANDDPTKANIVRVVEGADIVVSNDASLDDLFASLDELF